MATERKCSRETLEIRACLLLQALNSYEFDQFLHVRKTMMISESQAASGQTERGKNPIMQRSFWYNAKPSALYAQAVDALRALAEAEGFSAANDAVNEPIFDDLARVKPYPTIKCLPQESNHNPLMMRFWCAFCERWHHHGYGNGHRAAHCCSNVSFLKPRGYVIKMMSQHELRSIKRAIDAYLKFASGRGAYSRVVDEWRAREAARDARRAEWQARQQGEVKGSDAE
jgi:hypothetical protein